MAYANAPLSACFDEQRKSLRSPDGRAKYAALFGVSARRLSRYAFLTRNGGSAALRQGKHVMRKRCHITRAFFARPDLRRLDSGIAQGYKYLQACADTRMRRFRKDAAGGTTSPRLGRCRARAARSREDVPMSDQGGRCPFARACYIAGFASGYPSFLMRGQVRDIAGAWGGGSCRSDCVICVYRTSQKDVNGMTEPYLGVCGRPLVCPIEEISQYP